MNITRKMSRSLLFACNQKGEVKMKEVIMYKCEYCGEAYETKEDATCYERSIKI